MRLSGSPASPPPGPGARQTTGAGRGLQNQPTLRDALQTLVYGQAGRSPF